MLREPETRFTVSELDLYPSMLQSTHHRIDLVNQHCVDLRLTTDELRDIQERKLDQFSDRYLAPAMRRMADGVFSCSRGAELIVTAPMELPHGLTAATCATGEKLNLRALTYYDIPKDFAVRLLRESPPIIMRFDMLWGALRRG